MKGVKILAVNGPVPPLGPNAKILADEVDHWHDGDVLTAADLDMIRGGLGLHWRRHPYRNRVAVHSARGSFPIAARLTRLGLLAEDHAEHYGRMRVFRVTEAGFNAIGILRPKKGLLDLVPKVVGPLPLAA